MVIRCSRCNKIRKFGTWVELHPVIAEQIEDEKFHLILCPDCETTPFSARHHHNKFYE
ncbi:MAG: hypothetical protein HY354_03440 [Planctomycetes bacterium]|nr:hypothetical protein [Planctomycetota bacterium]